MVKIAIKIKPRKEVLDSSGRAIFSLLKNRNFPISDCHSGKYLELDIDETNEKKALDIAEKATHDILHNPLVETFEMEVVKTSESQRG